MARRNTTPTAPPKRMMVASAARVAPGLRLSREANASWMEKAWALYDESGELRFSMSWISNSGSQVPVVLGHIPPGGTTPIPVREQPGTELSALEVDALALTSELGGGPVMMPELMQQLCGSLALSGLAWLVIEEDETQPTGWRWTGCSNDELRDVGGGWEVEYRLGDDPEWESAGWRPLSDNAVVIKLWKRHLRHGSQPDSPVRAAIPILEQLRGIDAHINATSRSRLAGNGVFFSPSEVVFASPEDAPEVDENGNPIEYANVDGLLESFIDNARLAISEPGEPSAVIPLTIEVPAEYIPSFRHMTFWSEYSEATIELSDRAVKRFALAMDMPPEAVTGMSDASHWAAWRVAEEGVTIHIAPLVRIITTAITLNWLHVNLIELGHDPIEVSRYVLYGDTTNLLVRPDKSADSLALYQEMELSGEAARRESGLAPEDAPSPSERRRRLLMRAMDRNPELSSVLLPVIAKDEITEADVAGIDWSAAERQTFGSRSLDGRRSLRDSTEQAGQSSPVPLRSMESPALVAAMDGLAYRALERAGNRLRAEYGRGLKGGNAMVASMDPAAVHTVVKVNNPTALLAGAFDRLPELAEVHGVDSGKLRVAMEGYISDVMVGGKHHSYSELTSWLGKVL